MTNPQFITFTGIDERTNLYEAYVLQQDYPIEWGILCSENPKGNPRYPSFDFIKYANSALCAMSIHLCGTISRNTLASSIIPDIAITFDRVQINSVEKYYNAESLSTLCNQSSLIVQHRGTSNFDSPYSDFCDLLYDPSAGRGEHPDEWPIVNPPSGKLVGYAGGISADNVKELVSNDIMDNQNYWIDMESSIRVDNYLDIGKCRKICEIVFGDPVS